MSEQKSDKKYFTVEEANRLVPQLLEIIPPLQEQYRLMRSQFPDVANAWKQARFNGGSLQGTDYLRCVLIANRLQKELESIGCEIKGIENGLVDFPAIRDGREVYLCWKHPEEKIEYWHDLDSGFAGRQPL